MEFEPVGLVSSSYWSFRIFMLGGPLAVMDCTRPQPFALSEKSFYSDDL